MKNFWLKQICLDRLTIKLGGETSFDIYPKGWDKTFALQHFEDYQCWFVGDRCGENGNDQAIYERLRVHGRSFEVRSTKETLNLIFDELIPRIVMIDKEITEKISQLLNNGFAFPEHLTSEERDEIEEELINYYNKSGFRSFIEEDMVYVADLNYKVILMIEITKNSIYFNSQEHVYLLDAVVATLEFITKNLPLKTNNQQKT